MPLKIVILKSYRSFVLSKGRFLSSNRQKLFIIISKKWQLVGCISTFREYCISYWYKSLSKIEDNDPFFWLLLWILLWKYNFCWSLFLVIMFFFNSWIKYPLHFIPSTKLRLRLGYGLKFHNKKYWFKKKCFISNTSFFIKMICCISSIIIPFKTKHKTILCYFQNQYGFHQICEKIRQGCSMSQ